MHKDDKIKIVIDNENAESNGYALKRYMHFYTLKLQDFESNLDWLTALVLHESFHIAQYKKFSNFFLIPYHTIPEIWFVEGDAVLAETCLSDAGRGRLPSFSLVYRTNLLSGINYSFYQQYLGSPITRSPDYYKVGYFMVCFLRKKYGTKFFDELANFSKHAMPKTFCDKLTELSGKSIQDHYEEMNAELLELWNWQLQGVKFSNTFRISPNNQSFYFPYTHRTGVITFRCDRENPGEFIFMDAKGNSRNIIKAQYNILGNLGSATDNYLLWTENVDDPLFGDRGSSYVQICIYDIKNEELKTINHNTRYMSAVISKDEKKILSIEYNRDYSESLRIFDLEKGTADCRVDGLPHEHIKHPIWYDDKNIIFISIIDSKAAIVMLNLDSNKRKIILPYDYDSISCPTLYKDFIIFSYAYSGIDNIYGVNMKNGSVYQIISRKFGAYFPSYDSITNRLYFSDYQVDGMNISFINMDEANWTPISNIIPKKVEYFKEVENQYRKKKLNDYTNHKKYNIEEYPILKKALTSWDLCIDAMLQYLASDNSISIIASSSDILKFYQFKSGLIYDFSYNTISVPIGLRITQFYPIISAYYKEDFSLFERTDSSDNEDDEKQKEKSKTKDIDEDECDKWDRYEKIIPNLLKRYVYINIKFPLTLSRLVRSMNFTGSLQTGCEYTYEKFTMVSWFQNNYILDVVLSTNKSRMDLRSKLLFAFRTRFSHVLYSEDIKGCATNISCKIGTPGFFKFDSFYFSLSTFISNNIRINNDEIKHVLAPIHLKDHVLKNRTTSYQMDYAFPICYPQLYWGNVSVDRVYAKILFEYLHLHRFQSCLWEHPKTVGVGLFFKLRIFGAPLIDIGIKLCYSFFKNELFKGPNHSLYPTIHTNLWNLQFDISTNFFKD